MKRHFSFRRSLPSRQRGVALIVALVVLVIIGLTSAAVMRGALSSDLVTNNTRVQTLATQAAQVALKYCEAKLLAPPPIDIILLDVPPDGQMAWTTFGNWTNVNMVNTVPTEFMKSELSSFAPGRMPECMAQRSTAGVAPTIVVTARGFSPDFQADEDTGATVAGSVVWLQYILAVNP
jgi:type II secretory pathway pseudopilin PulG